VGVLVFLGPLVVFLYGRSAYGRLTPAQRVMEVALNRGGLHISGSSEAVDVPWEAIAGGREGKCAFYLIDARGRGMMLPKGEGPDPRLVSEVREALRSALGSRGRFRKR